MLHNAHVISFYNESCDYYLFNESCEYNDLWYSHYDKLLTGEWLDYHESVAQDKIQKEIKSPPPNNVFANLLS